MPSISNCADTSDPDDTLRILRVITRLNIGGPSIHVTLLSRHLYKLGYKTLLVSGEVEAGEGRMDYLVDCDVEHIYLPSLKRSINPFRDLGTLLKLIRIMKDFRPHIVHTHHSKAGTLGRLAGFFSGVPVIVHTFHGHTFRGYFPRWISLCFRLVEKCLGTITDRLVAVSDSVRFELVDRYKIAPPRKVEVIRLGFNLEPFLSAQCGILHDELELDEDIRLVGIVGRLTPVKNHRFFLDMARTISREMDNVRFVIVGDGELKHQIVQLASRMNLSQKVFFLGWRRDLSQIYRSFSTTVLCSINEGTPVTLIESQAAGVPVIATDVGGVQEVMKNGETGILVAPGDVEKFYKSVEKLISDPHQARIMGMRGRDFVRERFSVDRMVSEHDALYRKLIGK